MAQSKDYIALNVYQAATRDFLDLRGDMSYMLRFEIINQAIDSIAGLFYDLMAEGYITKAPIIFSTPTCKYLISGTATFTVSTSTLSGATMGIAFDSTDVGKIIAMRDSANGYLGIISGYVSGTSVTISGTTLPTADTSNIADVIAFKSVASAGSVNLSTLRIMKTGQQVRMRLESSATTEVRIGTTAEIATFNPNAKQNKNVLLWTFVGDDLVFTLGSGLANAGTLTLWYPRQPLRVTQDSSPIDIADGIPMNLLIMKVRSLIAEQLKIPVPDQTGKILALVKQLYITDSQTDALQKIEDKVEALK